MHRASRGPMLASLPMYTTDRAANEALWSALSRRLRALGLDDVPAALDWPGDLQAHWRRLDLLLSQTCGYPLATQLDGIVRVIGAFRYAAPGCLGIRYRSLIVARADDPAADLAGFRGGIAAYNSRDSQSGYNSFRAAVAPLAVDGRFFGGTVETGGHRASMEAVANGKADIATIDCVTFAGVSRIEPALAEALKIVGETATAPGLPLITRGSASEAEVGILRRAIGDVVADPALADIRSRLMIAGFEPIDADAYADIGAMERTAIASGYPMLA